jgi:hypothetical protein
VGKKNLPMALNIRRKPWIFSMAFFVRVDPALVGECDEKRRICEEVTLCNK